MVVIDIRRTNREAFDFSSCEQRGDIMWLVFCTWFSSRLAYHPPKISIFTQNFHQITILCALFSFMHFALQYKNVSMLLKLLNVPSSMYKAVHVETIDNKVHAKSQEYVDTLARKRESESYLWSKLSDFKSLCSAMEDNPISGPWSSLFTTFHPILIGRNALPLSSERVGCSKFAPFVEAIQCNGSLEIFQKQNVMFDSGCYSRFPQCE